MQSLTTKFIPCTNTKGSRIQVKASRGTKYYSYNHALNAEQNHYQAAIQCAKDWDWVKDGDQIVFGGYDKGYHAVIVAGYNSVIIT